MYILYSIPILCNIILIMFYFAEDSSDADTKKSESQALCKVNIYLYILKSNKWTISNVLGINLLLQHTKNPHHDNVSTIVISDDSSDEASTSQTEDHNIQNDDPVALPIGLDNVLSEVSTRLYIRV